MYMILNPEKAMNNNSKNNNKTNKQTNKQTK